MPDELMKAVSLAERAMRFELKLEELFAEWPEMLVGDPFWDIFADDLESAIAHVPSGFLDSSPDYEQYRCDWDFLLLYLDYALVKTGRPTSELLSMRHAAVRARPSSTAEIDQLIDRLESGGT